jgi:hypothetical protein
MAGNSRRAFHKAHPCDVMVVADMPDNVPRAWFIWGPGRGGKWVVVDPILTPNEARAKVKRLNGKKA